MKKKAKDIQPDFHDDENNDLSEEEGEINTALSGGVDGSMETSSIYRHELSKYPPVDPKEQNEWAEQILAGNEPDADEEAKEIAKEARTKLINANLRLVVSVAGEFMNAKIPFMDLVTEGNIALCRAANTYDVRMGNAFSTYAYKVIRTAINDYVRKIKCGNNMESGKDKNAKRILQAFGALSGTYSGGKISYNDVADALGDVDVEEVKKVLTRANAMMVSLDEPISKNGDSDETLEGQCSGGDDSLSLVEANEKVERVASMIERLDDKERMVIVRSFGLDGNNPETNEAIAKDLHCSGERVRQIREKALMKMRQMGE